MKIRIICMAFLLALPSLVLAQSDIVNTAASAGNFDTLVSLLVATGLDDALEADGSFTVFAPTDEAFAKLRAETIAQLRKPENREQLSAILKYHVVGQELSVPKRRPSHPITSIATLQGSKINFEREGSEVTVNGANIVQRNIHCSNGLIHVIDAVLLPTEDDSIVAVAAKAKQFKTLLAAAQAAGLADTLAKDGPFTVFAPTDDAFEAIEAEVQELLKPENKEQLAAVLKLHVVEGRVSAAEAVKAGNAETLEGSRLSVSITDGRLMINSANVLKNDISAGNGVIHVIDRVLLPTPDVAAELRSEARIEELTIRADWRNRVKRSDITTDRLIIEVAGGGSADLSNVMADEVVTRVAGGGTLLISGKTRRHQVTVNGGAQLRAFDLETDETKLQVNGGGVADVFATSLLNVSANSGAKVRYAKSDATITKRINKYASFAPYSGPDH